MKLNIFLQIFNYQAKKSKLAKVGHITVSKVFPSDARELSELQVDSGANGLPETVKTGLSSLKDSAALRQTTIDECSTDDCIHESQASGTSARPLIPPMEGFMSFYHLQDCNINMLEPLSYCDFLL